MGSGGKIFRISQDAHSFIAGDDADYIHLNADIRFKSLWIPAVNTVPRSGRSENL